MAFAFRGIWAGARRWYVPEAVVVLLAAAAATVWQTGAGAGVAIATAPATACPARYATFDPSHLTPVRVPEYHSLDIASVGDRSVPLAGRSAPITLGQSRGELEIRGWAVDAGARQPSSAVYAVIGAKTIVAQTGMPRDDVAAALHWPGYSKSGFAIGIPVEALPSGRSTIVLKAVTADGRGSYVLSPSVTVVRP